MQSMKFDLGFEEELMGSTRKFDRINGLEEICCFMVIVRQASKRSKRS